MPREISLEESSYPLPNCLSVRRYNHSHKKSYKKKKKKCKTKPKFYSLTYSDCRNYLHNVVYKLVSEEHPYAHTHVFFFF